MNDPQPIYLSRSQVREIDRRSIEAYHIPGIVLMENAARAVVDAACTLLGGGGCRGEVLVLCGGGNNGGDGLAVARHLHNRGAVVTVGLTADPAAYAGDALVNWHIVQAMGLPVAPADPALIARPGLSLVIDAVFGTGLTKAPRDPFPALAEAVAHARSVHGVPVLAVDVPSGLDCDTGRPPGACIRADHTITFVAEKIGFAAPEARPYLGHVTVGDIGCPRELIGAVAGNPNPGGTSGGTTS